LVPPDKSKPTQLPLAFPFSPVLSRENFIVSPANAEALAFIEAWPDWNVSIAAIYGPPGCGKTHLAAIWQAMSGARRLLASDVKLSTLREQRAKVIEDIDAAEPTQGCDSALFTAMQTAGPDAPLLLTGAAPPSQWPCILPDLASRFSALVALPVRTPDEGVLTGLAQKLFTDRQISVPEEVIERMLLVLERSPAALRAFVADVDAAALSEARPVSISLVRRLLEAHQAGS
jgi:chromosomal replication initiation ATPase DnaA